MILQGKRNNINGLWDVPVPKMEIKENYITLLVIATLYKSNIEPHKVQRIPNHPKLKSKYWPLLSYLNKFNSLIDHN